MRLELALLAPLLILVAAFPIPQQSPASTPKQGSTAVPEGLRQFPGTRVKLRIPKGFEFAPGVFGYFSRADNAIFAAVEGFWPKGSVPTDCGEASERETFEVLERTELKISGHRALLLRAQDRPAVPGQVRWFLHSCEGARFIRVQATLGGTSDARAREIVAMLRSAVWDLQAQVDVSETLDATVQTPKGMDCTYCFERQAKFTSAFPADGVVDRTAAAWEVVQCDTKTKASQLEAECRARLWDAMMSSSNAVETVSHAVEVSGASGWEIEASRKAGSRGQVYWHALVLLRDPGHLVVFLGHAPEADSKTWLPLFREAARSWKPRLAPKPVPEPK